MAPGEEIIENTLCLVRSPEAYVENVKKPAAVDVYVYGLSAKQNDTAFAAFFCSRTHLTADQCAKFLLLHDTAIFQDISISEAVDPIRQIEGQGLVAAINGLANPRYYLKQFKKFSAHGRFVWTWNWPAAIFTGLWQVFRSLWIKATLYFIVFSVFVVAAYFLPFGGSAYVAVAAWLLSFIIYGAVSNYDYYLKKARGENFWPAFSYHRFKGVFWVLIGVGAVASLLFFGNFVRQSMKVVEQFQKNIFSTGESMTVEGITCTPPAGWQIVKDIPGSLPQPMGSPVMFFPRDGAGDGLAGPLLLFVKKPPKGKSYTSMDQKEIVKLTLPLRQSFNNPLFRLMGVKITQTPFQTIKIAGHSWMRSEEVLRLGGSIEDPTVKSEIYYTVGNDRFVMLTQQASSTRAGEKSAAEIFAATIRFDREGSV